MEGVGSPAGSPPEGGENKRNNVVADLAGSFEEATAKRTRRSDDESFFAPLLEDAGMELRTDGPWLMTTQAQAPPPLAEHHKVEGVAANDGLCIVAQVRTHLERALQYERSAQERFVAGLREHLDDPDRLKAALLPAKMAASGEVGAALLPAKMAASGEAGAHALINTLLEASGETCAHALINTLLEVNVVQASAGELVGMLFEKGELVGMLFEKVPEYFADEEEGGLMLDSEGGGLMIDSVPRLVLNQLKWIEFVQPESKVTTKLIELIEVAPLHLKREALAALAGKSPTP
ncbi:hypothetical protein T484DRAFT_1782303 [Baffinella frigidus]|nr:hypothetical protein T484DRAFT_1782303 [Cryptophyta sp. CCMP2293]